MGGPSSHAPHNHLVVCSSLCMHALSVILASWVLGKIIAGRLIVEYFIADCLDWSRYTGMHGMNDNGQDAGQAFNCIRLARRPLQPTICNMSIIPIIKVNPALIFVSVYEALPTQNIQFPSSKLNWLSFKANYAIQ